MQSKIVSLDAPDVYHEIVDAIPDGLTGSELVLTGYKCYSDNYDIAAPKQRPVNGRVFECLILEALFARGIYPIYYQARVANVPNIIYDILLFHPIQPVALSCKTSLRERWKQADLEALALKQVYRGSMSALLTLSSEGYGVQKSIEDSNVLGLEQCIVIQNGGYDFDDLLIKLSSYEFEAASRVMPVTGQLLE